MLLVRAGLNDGERRRRRSQTSVATTPLATTAATEAPATDAESRSFVGGVSRAARSTRIALDNDTTVEQLLQLNPGLDPTGLQVGQRIRVR